MQIRIDTIQARETASQLIAQAECLSDIGQMLRSAIVDLDTHAWDGHSRVQAEPLLERVRPECEQTVQQIETLGRRLSRIAEAFDEADKISASEIDALPWSAIDAGLSWFTNPALRIGTLLTGGGAVLTPAALPFVGSYVGLFVGSSKDIPASLQGWLSPLVSQFLFWMGWQQPEIKDLPPAQLQSPAPAPSPSVPITDEIETAPLPANVLTPALKQTAGSYECAPTAVSMILQYFNKVDANNVSLTPQEIISGLGDRFNSINGINAGELVDGLKEMNLGYDTIDYQTSLDKAALQAELANGPVVAQVHLNWGTDTYAHMVTVTGITEDGEAVYVNDPWTGQAEEISWETFERSWTFDGPYSSSSNLIVRIRP